MGTGCPRFRQDSPGCREAPTKPCVRGRAAVCARAACGFGPPLSRCPVPVDVAVPPICGLASLGRNNLVTEIFKAHLDAYLSSLL